MLYQKPEVAVIGDANLLIQGSKDLITDNGVTPGNQPAETIE